MPKTTTPKNREISIPPQHQSQPGRQREMSPAPDCGEESYRGHGRLEGKVALITGGDSGIGRAVAIAFARESADVAIVYLEEHDDARDTARWVTESGRKCLLMAGDIGEESFCREAVERTVEELGRLDILINNAAEQHTREPDLSDTTAEDVERTFRTNIISQFSFSRAALEHMKQGATIINCTSVNSYKGNAQLIDYASTKGAITSFTRSLALSLAERGIRVNGVAPGPVWTPLIPATFPEDKVKEFGQQVPMKRPGQPVEIACCFVFLACDESSYMTGQVLHPNGGYVVGA